MYYGDKRASKVKIAHALMARGWKVYGYTPDRSDSMTDYYAPAYWEGIATKNGFTLVIDNSTNSKSGYIHKTLVYNGIPNNIQEKIEKLSQMTVNRGASEQEEETAKRAIEKLQEKRLNAREEKVIEEYPTFTMGNMGRCKWHIEKDGELYGKGTGVFQFSGLPYNYDVDTFTYDENYYYNRIVKPSEDQQKIIDKFEKMISKFEKIANQTTTVTDGSEGSNERGQQQANEQKLEKVVTYKTKTVKKMIEVTNRNYFIKGDYITMSYHNHYWKVTSVYDKTGTWNDEKKIKQALNYESVGSAKRGYQQLKNPKGYYSYVDRLQKYMSEGKVKIYELKEIQETEEVVKWVKRKQNKSASKKVTCNSVQKVKEVKEESDNKKTLSQDTTLIDDYTVSEDIDTRDNTPIFVLRIKTNLSRNNFLELKSYIKSIDGYYSRYKHGFIFKDNPTEVLINTPRDSIIKFKQAA